MVMAVSTDQVSRVEEDPKYLILLLSFYPQDDENQPPKSEVKVIMPNTWTPKIFLSALNKSIRKNLILSIELITIDGRVYATINELQWLFSATEEAMISALSFLQPAFPIVQEYSSSFHSLALSCQQVINLQVIRK
jgi:hypothetical protein